MNLHKVAHPTRPWSVETTINCFAKYTHFPWPFSVYQFSFILSPVFWRLMARNKRALHTFQTILLWTVICISVCFMIHRVKIWWLLKHFSHRCISLHIMINHEVPGYIMKDPEGYWNSIMTYHNCLWESPSEFHEKSWSVMICIITFQRGKLQYHWYPSKKIACFKQW